MEREHETNGDCWCNPRTIVVPRRKHNGRLKPMKTGPKPNPRTAHKEG